MNLFRNTLLVAALVGVSLTASYAAEGEKPGKGDKVEVSALPEAVKATFTKEAPDAKEVFKSNREGKETYRAKIKGADGKTVMLVVGADGAVISKEPAKEKPAK